MYGLVEARKVLSNENNFDLRRLEAAVVDEVYKAYARELDPCKTHMGIYNSSLVSDYPKRSTGFEVGVPADFCLGFVGNCVEE